MIVFALAGSRYATDLRWVREVITLGFVSEVPTAPPGVPGAFNLRGAIVPVLDLQALLGGPPLGAVPRQGDSALLVEAEHALAALRVDTIDEVGTLAAGAAPDTVIDGRGRVVPVVDPPAVVRRAMEAAWAVRGIPRVGDAALPGVEPAPHDEVHDG